MSATWWLAAGWLVVSAAPARAGDAGLAARLAEGIARACPAADPASRPARDSCAEGLSRLAPLRESMAEPFLWGAQKKEGDFSLAQSSTTRFNPLVWRSMYLPLFMFPGSYRVERSGETEVIHLPCRLRAGLDAGEFPYPFWHSKRKWASYQTAQELLLVLRGGKLLGALRSARRGTAPAVARAWDGNWRWTAAAGQDEPRAALYRSLLSPKNPHAEELESAYRALEARFRKANCLACHSPDNGGGAKELEILSHPNQALVARHDLVAQLEKNAMPPRKGLKDKARLEMLDLAKRFEAAAEKALAYEKEAGR